MMLMTARARMGFPVVVSEVVLVRMVGKLKRSNPFCQDILSQQRRANITQTACYPQIVNLNEDAGFNQAISCVLSAAIMIWMTEIWISGSLWI
jgi:hypothetical protein